MQNKTLSTTILLCLFLGTFGAHQFYLENNKKAIFYLLFCWTGLPTLISLIDFIIFVTMSKLEFYQKYC